MAPQRKGHALKSSEATPVGTHPIFLFVQVWATCGAHPGAFPGPPPKIFLVCTKLTYVGAIRFVALEFSVDEIYTRNLVLLH